MDNHPIRNAEWIASGVSRPLAVHRSSTIRNVTYTLSLRLDSLDENRGIDGEIEIAFDLAEAPRDPIILDFRDLTEQGEPTDGPLLGAPLLNGRASSPPLQINGHLLFDATQFSEGRNRIFLCFQTRMATAGRPILRYLDREDGSVYVYTLVVPMDASLIFPCFDQPDLKARFSLTVEGPSEWNVIANGSRLAPHREDPPGRHRFATTEPISTYLFAFAAGPFVALGEAQAPLPLQLHVRRSQVNPAREAWPALAALTTQGIRYLSEYFGHRFPFPKYDQVLLPGFPYRGMEHAGATFLREDAILFRATPTEGDLLNRAALLLHELVHQWFGDLVTMQWFDDLWLKEGFANYMAYRALAEFPPGGQSAEEIWKRFYLAHKPMAYTIDGSLGTTPLHQEIENLKDAKSAYGAIVYQKAPGLLRALCYQLGEENFRAGVRRFVARHAYGNATWKDLVDAFSDAAGKPLATWANAWIRERGMARIEVEWNSQEGRLSEMTVRQEDLQGEGRHWPIETQLVVVGERGRPIWRQRLRLDGERVTIREPLGQSAPRFIFANEGDYGYGLFLLDAKSQAAVIDDLPAIEDPFLRALLWGALWEAVREGEFAPEDYLALILRASPRENDEDLLQSLLERAGRTYQRYLSPAQQSTWLSRIEAQWAAGMMESRPLGARILYFRAFRAHAATPAGQQRLKTLLAGQQIPPGIELKPLDRWRILAGLLASADPEAEQLLAAEIRRDHSDDASKQAYLVGAARPDASCKQQYFADYLSQSRPLPEDWIEGSLPFFHQPLQASLTLPYLERALTALPRLKQERKIFFVLAWLTHFLGGQTGEEALQIVRQFLARQSLDPDLTLKVREVTDELERTVQIRKRFAAPPPTPR